MNTDERFVQIVPSEKQLNWQKLEFTAFLHYGMNSFMDREWGDGTEDISVFNPQAMDTDDWCESLVKAGIKAAIITAKHHDGFCLFHTKYTEHSVMHSPFGKDIVESFSKSCMKYGLKFGVYLSPWDRHEGSYGYGKAYDDYFCAQLTELLSNYGDVYTVWFDGACGEGDNGKKQIYDWERYYEVIHRLQPEAVISICGPDVRWCGNEAGDCREFEWSVVPERIRDNEKIQENSQKEDNEEFRQTKIDMMDKDLGSRLIVEKEKDLIWYPAEVDTSIRPGWFHHDAEDSKVRSLETLFHIYLKSVGGNSVFLLNIPPHRDGYITEADKKRLEELGNLIQHSFQNNLMADAVLSADASEEPCCIESLKTLDETYWKTPDHEDRETQGIHEITITFDTAKKVTYIMLMEQIKLSQRVESFEIFAETDGEYQKVYTGGTIGYKRICELDRPCTSGKWKIRFTDFRVSPTLKFLGMY